MNWKMGEKRKRDARFIVLTAIRMLFQFNWIWIEEVDCLYIIQALSPSTKSIYCISYFIYLFVYFVSYMHMYTHTIRLLNLIYSLCIHFLSPSFHCMLQLDNTYEIKWIYVSMWWSNKFIGTQKITLICITCLKIIKIWK